MVAGSLLPSETGRFEGVLIHLVDVRLGRFIFEEILVVWVIRGAIGGTFRRLRGLRLSGVHGAIGICATGDAERKEEDDSSRDPGKHTSSSRQKRRE